MQKYQLEEKDRLLCVSFPDQDIMGIEFGDKVKSERGGEEILRQL